MYFRKFTCLTGTVRKISGTLWEVREPFFWWIDYETKQDKVTVEEGFQTDFGSVPRFLWSIINPTGWNAFVLHDYMYATKYMSRVISDCALYDALVVEGCPKWKAWIIFAGVRLGGSHFWN